MGGAVVGNLLNTDPPYNVRVEPRSNNAIAAGMSAQWDASNKRAIADAPSVPRRRDGAGHHQRFDLERHPEKAQPTHRRAARPRFVLENVSGPPKAWPVDERKAS